MSAALEVDAVDVLPRLRALIAAQEDVRAVLALVPVLPAGRFACLIETTFPTFPRYVIGLTTADNDEVQVEFRCGAWWSAEEAWLSRYGALPGAETANAGGES